MEIPSLPVIEEPVEEVMYLQIPGMVVIVTLY